MKLLLATPTFSLCEPARQLLLDDFDIDTWSNVASEVIWLRLQPFNQVKRRHFPKLKLIVAAMTGTDHITARGVEILSLKGETEFLETVHATAEHTIALMLALLRKLPQAMAGLRPCGSELHGKTVLIVGRGRVGKQVGSILDAFGCTVMYVDRDGDLLGTLPLADIVSVHVDLNPSTEALFSHDEFAAMKDGAYFISTSRGAVVDEGSLDFHLDRLGGTALDVHAHEPEPPRLCRRDNLIITPHIGGNTVESIEKTEIFMAKKLLAWKNNQSCKATSNLPRSSAESATSA